MQGAFVMEICSFTVRVLLFVTPTLKNSSLRSESSIFAQTSLLFAQTIFSFAQNHRVTLKIILKTVKLKSGEGL
jgi:hypothetical protein